MPANKVIDADGHIIERTDELRKYLKAPFNKRVGPLTASEPWDRDLQHTLPPEPRKFPSAPDAQDWLRLLDDYTIEKVATGYRFTEGPAWSREGYMVFSDLPSQRIYKWTPGSAPEILRENSGRGNGNAFDSAGRLYTCEGGTRRVVRADKQGRIEVLADSFEGKKLNSPNDLVLRHDSQVYFTDPAYGSSGDALVMAAAGSARGPRRSPLRADRLPACRRRTA